MPVRHPFRRIILVLGVWGLLLSGILLSNSGTARALPDPQAVEDATLVVIVRPDGKVPDGYRVEQIFSDQEATKVGDLLLLPGLNLDIPSEDSKDIDAADSATTPQKSADVSPVGQLPAEPEQGVEEEADAAAAKAAPVVQPTYASPPANAFPEAPIPKPPVFKTPKKSKNKKPKEAPQKSAPQKSAPQNPPAKAVPTAAPSAFPEAPPNVPPNAFPEAPVESVPALPPTLNPPLPPVAAFPEAPPTALPNGLTPPVTDPAAVPGVAPVNPLPNDDLSGAPTPSSVPVPTVVPGSPTISDGHGVDPGVRVLVYLWYAPNGLSHYSVTGDGRAYAWVKDSAHVDVLRQQARQALDARRDWHMAAALTEPKARLAAFWPFLSGYEGRYNALAQLQYSAMGATGGNYLAARWNQLDSKTRMTLLPALSSFHSPALHRVLTAHLQGLQHKYEVYLVTQEVPLKDRADDWVALPEKMKAVYGEIYYGLIGLTGFKDRSDLPYIRKLATWALKFRFKQTNDAALGAFKAMPAEANLPIIADTWREYSTRPIAGNELVNADVIATLAAHRFPASVPLLAVFLRDSNPKTVALARTAMRSIAGKDLGADPMVWLNWARVQDKAKMNAAASKATATPTSTPQPVRTSPLKSKKPRKRFRVKKAA